MPRRLCILSGNLMRCDAFIPALTSLSRDDELEIVRDRRRGAASSEATNRPVEERRCRPYLDLALKVDGFAIVVAAFATMPALQDGLSLIVPDAPRSGDQPKPAGQPEESAVATQTLPPVTEAPATNAPEPAASPSAVAANTEPDRGREPLTPAPALPPEPSTRAARPRSARVTPRVVPPPIASARVTSPGPVKREWSPPLPGVPRVELS